MLTQSWIKYNGNRITDVMALGVNSAKWKCIDEKKLRLVRASIIGFWMSRLTYDELWELDVGQTGVDWINFWYITLFWYFWLVLKILINRIFFFNYQLCTWLIQTFCLFIIFWDSDFKTRAVSMDSCNWPNTRSSMDKKLKRNIYKKK